MLQCNIVLFVKKSTCGSNRCNFARLHMEGRRLSYALEQGCLSRGHPHLATAFETGEERGTPLGVKVGRNLIEQQDRRLASALRHQLGVSQNEAEEQRFLFAR